ncbi:MAG: glutathione S-transferase family protein [Rhodomicrobiaceae bacterium]
MDGNYELVIGNKNLSSWSLRPWLVLKAFDIPFKETPILLRQPDSRANILSHSPSGKVPALNSGGLIVWDSLAIIEFLAERHPNLPIWPTHPEARAIARCIAAEMHSGFPDLRNELPMDFVNIIGFPQVSDKTLADIGRIIEIWMDCRRRFGGSGAFLFGDFCAADAMFAPVASRFTTYQVDLARFGDDGVAASYRETMMAMPEMQAWGEAARAES